MKWSRPNLQFLLIMVLAVAVYLVIWLAGREEPKPDPEMERIEAHYLQWRGECERYASEVVDTRVYRIGGQHWADVVNDCMVKKAED